MASNLSNHPHPSLALQAEAKEGSSFKAEVGDPNKTKNLADFLFLPQQQPGHFGS